MVRKVDPAKVDETTQELVKRIAVHIVPRTDPRSCFGFNLWFKQAPISTYIRQGRRTNLETMEWVYTLEIATIDVKAQGKGYFTSFLDKMEVLARHHGLNILVENVQSERLEEFMKRRNYVPYRNRGEEGPPTYWNV